MKKTEVEMQSRVIVGAHGVAAEEDHILTLKVVWVGVVSLVIFLVGGIWAWRLHVATLAELAPDGQLPIPPAVGQYEIGIVNQRMFDVDTHAVEKIGAQEEALVKGTGEQPGVAAYTPITQAIDAVIANQAAPTAPQPAPTPAPAPEAPKP